MATWHVALDASVIPPGSVAGNGTSITSMWPNLASVVYGGAGFKGGDTLRVYGDFALSAVWSIGNHGATSWAAPATIIFTDGTYVRFLNPAHYIWNTRQFTIVRCEGSGKVEVFLNSPLAQNFEMGPFAFDIRSGYSPLCLGSTGDVGTHKNLKFHDITINGNDALPMRTTVAAIRGRVDANVACNYDTITFERIKIRNFKATRGCLSMFLGPNPNARARDIIINDVECENIAGLAVDMECAGPDIGYAVPGQRNWSQGFKIQNVRVKNQDFGISYNTTTMVHSLNESGGAVFVSGFGPSTTPGFGENRVDEIHGVNLHGNAGLVDAVACTFGFKNWSVDGLTPFSIDGCGFLLDSGCYNIKGHGLDIRNLYGLPGLPFSGAAVLVLDNVENCDISGVVVDNVNLVFGVYDEKGTPGTCTVRVNQVAIANAKAGVRFHQNVNPNIQNVEFSNVTCQGSGPGVVNLAVKAWSGESSCYWNMGMPNTNHTFSATSKSGVDPQLDPVTLRPKPGSPLIGAGKFVGNLRDFNGLKLKAKPSIGAFEDTTVKPRKLRK